MNVFDRFSVIARAPAAEGGAPPPAVAAPGASPPATPLVPPAAGAGAQPPAANPGQAPGQPPAAPPPVADYWPDGLDPQYRGADPNTTLDNVAAALKGYRDRDAKRDVPEKPEGYYNFENLGEFKIDPKNQPYFDQLPNDPAFKAMASVMHQHGIGRVAGLAAYQAGLTAMAEAGMLEPLLDVKAEMAALVPEAARNAPEGEQKQAVQRRMQENYDFLKLMETNRGLSPESSKYAEMMLGDSAKGHQFFEWMRAQVQGGQGTGQPGAVGNRGGAATASGLQAQMAALSRSDPQYREKYAELEKQYQGFFGD